MSGGAQAELNVPALFRGGDDLPMADAEPAVISANLGPAPATVSDLNKKIYGTIEGATGRSRASIPTSIRMASCSAHLGWRGAQHVASGGDRGEWRG